MNRTKELDVDARVRFADIVTLLNLLAGVFALYATLLGNINIAIALVCTAAVFDMFDGKVARLLKQEHSLGRELDSLSDMISFGIAPSLILLAKFKQNILVLIGVALFAMAGAYRLARFNLQATKVQEMNSGKRKRVKMSHFEGIPIPVAGLLLMLVSFLPVAWEAFLCAIILGSLMVSRVRIKKL